MSWLGPTPTVTSHCGTSPFQKIVICLNNHVHGIFLFFLSTRTIFCHGFTPSAHPVLGFLFNFNSYPLFLIRPCGYTIIIPPISQLIKLFPSTAGRYPERHDRDSSSVFIPGRQPWIRLSAASSPPCSFTHSIATCAGIILDHWLSASFARSRMDLPPNAAHCSALIHWCALGHPQRQEPDEAVRHVRICAGGTGQLAFLPRPFWPYALQPFTYS